MIISQLLGKAGFFPSPCFLILVHKQIPVPWFIRVEVFPFLFVLPPICTSCPGLRKFT